LLYAYYQGKDNTGIDAVLLRGKGRRIPDAETTDGSFRGVTRPTGLDKKQYGASASGLRVTDFDGRGCRFMS